jgi:hypothetical protein
MAYFIFLKYLRSLEEFRKNPHVKIPPKSPCVNFQTLGKFKNPFSSLSTRLTLPAHSAFGPASPAGPSPPPPTQAKAILTNPSSPCVGGIFAEVRFPFWFAPSELVASLSSLCQAGPGCQLHLPPRTAAPRAPALQHGMPPEPLLPHHHSPPPNPLLTLPSSSMALKPLTPPLLPPATSLRCARPQ